MLKYTVAQSVRRMSKALGTFQLYSLCAEDSLELSEVPPRAVFRALYIPLVGPRGWRTRMGNDVASSGSSRSHTEGTDDADYW